ncbi:MAG TPA: YibE/F family protein, partial [Clostridia bacterium]|nr:YibE/F family protein [Clostridia bacterium]
FILLPLIFQGYDPAPVAVLCASLACVASFVLISGFHKKTYAAIFGTICGVTAAGIISWAAGALTHVSGVTMENSEQLLYVAQDYNIKIRGLMFTSILISSLGAVMDVAMSISSSTFEIYQANPKLTSRQLMKAAMNVGKDIMGTMADTLILAFAGGAFNVMMLIWGFQMSYRQFLNIPLIKTEIIQSLAGSIGIVLTVPVTAFIAVALFMNKPTANKKKKGKVAQ